MFLEEGILGVSCSFGRSLDDDDDCVLMDGAVLREAPVTGSAASKAMVSTRISMLSKIFSCETKNCDSSLDLKMRQGCKAFSKCLPSI